MRRLNFLHKRNGSGDQGCPAAYALDDGGIVIQGYRTATPGVVRVENDVIDRLPHGGAGFAHAITRAGAGHRLVTGEPITDPGEVAQLRQLADDETAVAVRSR
jgi:hypothetical protein